MTSDPNSHERPPFRPQPGGDSERRPGERGAARPVPAAGHPDKPRVTRAGMTWAAVVTALVVFVLLVVFFIQNQDLVLVRFLGFEGPVPLGLALFIAAVAGGVLVAVVGAVRIIQLRAAARRLRHTTPSA
ncbi:lipopolysaccharide assembly protein LapA domain-containing protein [Sinomonas mesophila]|uniref:lipopolysaccharide assembly protein LapA domain-containing protein n=1 Tax=Sinomonas mesophila TaxID=1531955 RepID=UPI001FE5A3F7|nr:lipopolysaccharide assembly protein LapA domain-containing protein [Sinomonas mesophila]